MKRLSLESISAITSLFGKNSFVKKVILTGAFVALVTGAAQAQVNVAKLAPVPDGVTNMVAGAVTTGPQYQVYWNGTAWVNTPAAGIGSITDNNVGLLPTSVFDAAAGFRIAPGVNTLVGQTYNVGTITLSETAGIHPAATPRRVAGIVYSDWYSVLPSFDGTINTQNISVTSVDNSVTGVAVAGYVEGQNPESNYGSGIAALGAINVKDVKVSSSGRGIGNGIQIGGNVAGTVTAGNIDVSTNRGSAVGFRSAAINNAGFVAGSTNPAQDAASVTLGNVSVSSTNVNAQGINVSGGVSTAHVGSGKLTVGDITAKSANGSATGANFNNGIVWGYENTGTFAGPLSLNIKSAIDPSQQNVKLGNINVATNGADGTQAVGINLNNVDQSRLVIDHDVIAKSTNSTALVPGAAPAAQAVGISSGAGSQGIVINNGVDGKDVEITGERTWVDANNNVRHTYSSIALGGGNDGLLVLGKQHTNNGKVFAVSGVEGVVYETDAEYASGSSFTFNNASMIAVADDKLVNLHGDLIGNAGTTLNIGQLPIQNLANPALVGANTNYKGTLVAHHLTGDGGANNDAFNGNITLDSGKLAISGAYQNKVAGNVTIKADNPVLAQAQPTVPPTLDAKDGNPGLYIYGNTTVGTSALAANAISGYNGALNAAMDANHDGIIDSAELAKQGIFSLSGISEYVVKTNALNSVVAQNRKTAQLSDAYLASAVLHNRLTGWSATRDHFISKTRKSRVVVSGQSPCDPCEPVCETGCDPCEEVSPCNPCDPCGKSFGTSSSLARNTWVNYVGRGGKFNSSFAPIGKWDTSSDGIQVGTDIYKTSRNQLGLLFGYEDSLAKSGDAIVDDKVKADDTYFGIYAAHILDNGADIRFVWTYGTQDYDLTRIDPSKLYPFHSFQTSYKGHTNEINLELGKRFYTNRYVSFRPSVGLDFYSNDLKTAVEGSGSAVAFDDLHYQGARVGYLGTNWHQTFLRIGSDLKVEKGAFTLDSGLYYSYDVAGDELQALVGAVNTLSQANIANGTAAYSMLRSVNLGRSYLTANLGGSLQLSKSLSVFGGYNGDFSLDKDSDAVSSTGYVGGIVKW